jgi:hypothetical protein
MRNSILKRLIMICLLFSAGGMMFSCSSREEPELEAEVKILNESVYVWNRGTQPWTGGAVFLNERSLGIKKTFNTINPKGFAQLPLREFKQDSEPIPESFDLKFVLVEVEGYAPKKFTL